MARVSRWGGSRLRHALCPKASWWRRRTAASAPGANYHLFAPRTKPLRDVVLAIRDWLIAQMQRDMDAIANLLR